MSMADDIAASNKRQSEFYRQRENEPWDSACHGDDEDCPYCSEPVLEGEPFVMDDGDKMHIHCAVEEQDGLDLDHFRD